MPIEMECPGITFTVQWKKKSGSVSRQEDVTSIGLWDTDESTLDWQTFKSYVCQNLGTVDNISVAYIDSEGDELPIESECEFQEALKFARQRARKGRETVLRVDRQESGTASGPAIKMAENTNQDNAKCFQMSCSKVKNKNGNKSHKFNSNGKNGNFGFMNEEKNNKDGKNKNFCDRGPYSSDVEQTELLLKQVLDKIKKLNLEQTDAPPPWFRRYIQKMKNDIVAEVTNNIVQHFEIQQVYPRKTKETPNFPKVGLLEKQDFWEKPNYVQTVNTSNNTKNDTVSDLTNRVVQHRDVEHPGQKDCSGSRSNNTWPLNKNKKKNKKKKKRSEEESSDGAPGGESRDHTLLKKFVKLHKRERKLEKKLDGKLEKLEMKTKRMMEKKSQNKQPRCEVEKLEIKTKRMMEKRSQCKSCCKKIPERRVCGGKKRSGGGDIQFGTYLMDALLLNDGPTSEITIYPGQHFVKVWEILNNGTLPWTDKTELRQAWGTSGLEPDETVVKCPILEPGERGIISMRFRAPEYPGKFKSFWHFYHMGDRFGHWLGSAVVVKDLKGEPSTSNDHRGDTHIQKKSEVMNKLQNHKNECDQSNDLIREEYESDLESDNLSVIYGPEYESSDSEDENFEVIPLPPCFMYDVPLGHADTVPVVKSEMKESKFININNNNNNTNDERVELCEERSFEIRDTFKNEQYEDMPLEKVYAVNSSGCCIAVKYSDHLTTGGIQTSTSAAGGNVSLKTYPCDNIHKIQKQENNACSSMYSDPVLGTEHVPADNMHQNSQGKDASNTNKHLSSGSLGHDPLTNVIHILPETLVNGAVNVASSAYSTACAVINNLQQRNRQHGEGSELLAVQPLDSKTTKNLERLLEMGFNNRVLNVLLLQRYNNDLTEVVGELVQYEE